MYHLGGCYFILTFTRECGKIKYVNGAISLTLDFHRIVFSIALLYDSIGLSVVEDLHHLANPSYGIVTVVEDDQE